MGIDSLRRDEGRRPELMMAATTATLVPCQSSRRLPTLSCAANRSAVTDRTDKQRHRRGGRRCRSSADARQQQSCIASANVSGCLPSVWRLHSSTSSSCPVRQPPDVFFKYLRAHTACVPWPRLPLALHRCCSSQVAALHAAALQRLMLQRCSIVCCSVACCSVVCCSVASQSTSRWPRTPSTCGPSRPGPRRASRSGPDRSLI